ncbi:hypothetical protein CSC3H3_07300 [Thalassospira marina]|uniref:Uncharacterized protein n=1 Tax=Thalassospira marina TaxID=2048283 RepID=A0A2N3KS54_9PROT|nr:hypothetical protein CSC3H3_07300 [Thalassospira marina]PKR53340.1 hypothetical protein COO20_14685 [Thalassospira marina]
MVNGTKWRENKQNAHPKLFHNFIHKGNKLPEGRTNPCPWATVAAGCEEQQMTFDAAIALRETCLF